MDEGEIVDFYEVIQKRRSVRKFKVEAIPDVVMKRVLDAGLKAPNSSNLQPWEFYRVRQAETKTKMAEACFNQSAAATAQEFIVCVARIDTWKKHRDYLVEQFDKNPKVPKGVYAYYQKLIPAVYTQDPLGFLGLMKRISMTAVGFFRPVPRGPHSRSELFNVVSKTTALACENIMLALVAEGYASCPMEGFDEVRVKQLLGLSMCSRVVMVISVGERANDGIWGEQFRVPKNEVVHVV